MRPTIAELSENFVRELLYSVKSTREIKEHDPHSAPRLLWVRQRSVQEEDDGIVHSNARLICTLEWVH